MKVLFFEVDLHAEAVYIHIREPADVCDTQQITPGINADYDIDGNVVGIEFLNTVMDFKQEFRLSSRDKEELADARRRFPGLLQGEVG